MKIVFVDQIATVNNKYSFSLIEKLRVNNKVYFISDEREYNGDNVVVFNEFVGITSKEKNKVNKTLVYMKAWKRIYDICKKENIDVLHVQWFILSPVDSYYIKKIKNIGIKIVVTVHDILPFNKKFYDYKCHKDIYEAANHIIVQAKPNIERINSVFREIGDKVVYIPHGNFINHVDIIQKEEARKLLNIDLDKKVILFFGQIKKVKGLDILLKAYYKFTKENKEENVLLLVAGKVWDDDFDRYKAIINKIDRDKIRCDIKYIPDEEISWYYCAADVNVLPYREVYQSGVVHLACAYEKAVIATKVGSFPEVIIDGESGILVETENVDKLECAIKKLILNEKKLIDMGKKGKKHIEENFSWDKISREIEKLYVN